MATPKPKKQKFDNEAMPGPGPRRMSNEAIQRGAGFRKRRMATENKAMEAVEAQNRVNRAKKKITELAGKGIQINLDRATNYTVHEIAKTESHPQYTAANEQQRKRGQTGFYSGSTYGNLESHKKIFDKSEQPFKYKKKPKRMKLEE